MIITQAQGSGQAQCTLCKKHGKWNVNWVCFMYKIEGMEGIYCKSCADELKAKIALYCMKSLSECEKELCENCAIYGHTGSDHCFEDTLQYVIAMLEAVTQAESEEK